MVHGSPAGSLIRNACPVVLNALVEAVAKSDALQASWQGNVLNVLVEVRAKSEALQATWQRNVLNALVEAVTKS